MFKLTSFSHYSIFHKGHHYSKEMKWLFAAHSLRQSLAGGFSGLFIPLFMYQQGQNMPWMQLLRRFFVFSPLQEGIIAYALFVIGFRILGLLLFQVTSFITGKIGFMKSMMIGNLGAIMIFSGFLLFDR